MGDLADALAGPRVLLIDLERRAGEAFIFDQRVRGGFLPLSNWTRYPAMLCFAAKWHGARRAEFHASWDSDDPHHLARESWRLVDEADIVVTYFGGRADLPWMRSAWVEAELPPPAPFKHLDMHLVGRQFGFPSASLQHLCERLGLPGKRGKYSPRDAEACIAGDEKARARMRRYNMGDVGPNSLEGVLDRLRPWISGVNYGLYGADDARVCVNCGGEAMSPAGSAVTAVTRYPAYRCDACGTVMRGKSRSAAVPMRGITGR